MCLTENAKLIESILFIENEPVSAERLCSMTNLTEEEVSEALVCLSDCYYSENHGIRLSENAETWSFVPVTDINERLRTCYGKHVDRRLSRSAVETLAIIAYSQPVTRSEITKIRGVNSDNVIRMLRERDFIKVVGRKDIQGHPCLYGTTKTFLYTFSLKSISELPKLSEIDVQRYEKEIKNED